MATPQTKSPVPRIVSLLPSATEHVAALGHGQNLVGISHECDYPKGLQHLPVLTSSKVLTQGSSLEIDRDVRSVLKDALAVYDLDAEKLETLRPDVIVTQDLCDVCAVSLKDVEAAAAHLLGDHVRVVNLHPLCLADIWTDLAHVADALGAQETLKAVMKERLGRIDRIQQRAKSADSTPKTLTIEWLDPIMIGGLWMPELIELGGGEPLVTKRKDMAPTLSDEELRSLDPAPEVVLIKPCGFDLKRTRQEAKALQKRLETFDWPAIHHDRVYVADGNAFFNRPGPRIVESLEILAACMHPDVFLPEAENHTDSFTKLSAWS